MYLEPVVAERKISTAFSLSQVCFSSVAVVCERAVPFIRRQRGRSTFCDVTDLFGFPPRARYYNIRVLKASSLSPPRHTKEKE